MSDKFITCEEIGRKIIEKKLIENTNITNYEFQDRYCHYDLLYTGSTNTYVVEIKYRSDYNSNAKCIVNGGLMLEKSKYDALVEKAKDGYIPIYITIFNDNVGYIYTISTPIIEWQTKELPKHTAVKDGKRNKQVTYIKLNECKKFYYNAND